MTTGTTLNRIFFDAAARFGTRPVAMRIKRHGAWTDFSWPEFIRRVRGLSAAFRELGLAPGDRVAILSENRPEWAVVDYAALTSRLVDVPVYATLPPAQIVHLLRDSAARVIFVSSAAQLEKVLAVRDELPGLEYLVAFDDFDRPAGVLSMVEVEARGAAAVDRYPDWETEARAARPDDIATIIYTSGTTGQPKGVMLTHGNIASNVTAALSILELRDSDSCLSFLPLCHIFERMVGHYTMLLAGVTIHYASSNEAVVDELMEVRPTLLASVPRLYEKIYARVVETVSAAGGSRKAIFAWARGVAGRHLDARLAGRRAGPLLAVQYRIADLLVFAKLRARLGGRIRFCVSGGAPLNPEIARFFLGAGIMILEGYGLTETSPVIAVNTFEHLRPGTVGRAIPGVEVRIAPDGEILARGPNIMKGYYGLPEATAEAIGRDGWFHTGDIGELDADGFLRITDRKKDLIVTAGGKNIAPQPIEALFKTNPFFVNAVMLGDRRRYPIMLLVPNFETLKGWLVFKGIPVLPPAELVRRPDVIDKLEREARKSLRDLAHFEIPKRFLILPEDFSLERGEITPKLSIRRKAVEERNREAIEALYALEPGDTAERPSAPSH